jgi:hypothetical protein
MKPTLLKLTLAVCAAMVATPTFAQPDAAAPASPEAAIVSPMCKCPGMVTKRFRSLMLARRWAASVHCARGRCPHHKPCLKNVTIRNVGYMAVATVRCRCRLGY